MSMVENGGCINWTMRLPWQRMALYMIRLALCIDIEKMSVTNAKTVEKRSETYTPRGIHSLELRVSYRHKNVYT